MAKNNKGQNPTKARSLAPIPHNTKGDRRGLGDRVVRHPLAPLVVGIPFTGLSKSMFLTMVGVFLCAVWLCFDLLPYANLWSARVANRFCLFTNHYGNYGREEAERKRTALQRSGRAIFFVAICGMVGLLLVGAAIWASSSILDDWKVETRKDMVGNLTFPEGGSKNNTKFTITNNSSHEIQLLSMTCNPRRVLLEYDNQIVGGGDTWRLNLPLHSAGDSQSENCPTENNVLHLGNMPIVCGDIEWEVNYVVKGAEADVQTKKYRYILNKGETAWSGVAVESFVPPC